MHSSAKGRRNIWRTDCVPKFVRDRGLRRRYTRLPSFLRLVQQNRHHALFDAYQTKQIAHSMFLEDRGFRFVELNYLPSLDNLQCEKVPYSEIEIQTATVADREYLVSLAERLQIGRFHHDPRVNSSAANRRYGQWVRRAFDNPKQRVLTCVCASQIVAFFVVETPGSTDRFWSLSGSARNSLAMASDTQPGTRCCDTIKPRELKKSRPASRRITSRS